MHARRHAISDTLHDVIFGGEMNAINARKDRQYREGWEEEEAARRKRNNCSDIPPRSSGASGVQSAARAEPPPIEPADASYA